MRDIFVLEMLHNATAKQNRNRQIEQFWKWSFCGFKSDHLQVANYDEGRKMENNIYKNEQNA